MKKIASALSLLLLAGCGTASTASSSVCSTQPGTYACQVEQYQNVND